MVSVFLVVEGNYESMKEFNAVAKGTISDEDLSRAKSVFVHEVAELRSSCFVYCRNQLKTRYLVGIETQASLAEDIAAQVLVILAPVADMLWGGGERESSVCLHPSYSTV